MCTCIIAFFLLLPLLDPAEIVELLAKQLVDRMFDAKENIDGNIIASLRKEHLVAVSYNHHINKEI